MEWMENRFHLYFSPLPLFYTYIPKHYGQMIYSLELNLFKKQSKVYLSCWRRNDRVKIANQ